MGSFCVMGTDSVWDEEKVLEIHSGDGYITRWGYLNATGLCE